jgi:5'-phosphate synthase pdxT subunit
MSAPKPLHIGVLALQGAFIEHVHMLEQVAQKMRSQVKLKISTVRTPQELEACDALIIPGGESTTMALVARRTGMMEPLKDFVKVKRRPTYGSCAGTIMLADEVIGGVKKGGQENIGGLSIRVCRNAYGRQVSRYICPV